MQSRRPHVELTATAFQSIVVEADRAYPHETGGILVGWNVPNTRTRFVKHVVGPGPNAKHLATRFEPDTDWQADQLAVLYADSGRIATYLGDWHTHPGGHAIPSALDRATMRVIAQHDDARCPSPLMLIVAGAESWSMRAWYQASPRWAKQSIRVVVPVAWSVRPSG